MQIAVISAAATAPSQRAGAILHFTAIASACGRRDAAS